MKTLLITLSILAVFALGLTQNREFDPNEIQVVGVPDPNMTYDQVMAGYLGLDAMEKEAFKLQIGYLEDASYIVFMNKNTKMIHRHDCRYVNDNCVPVLRDSAVKNGAKPCGVCKP